MNGAENTRGARAFKGKKFPELDVIQTVNKRLEEGGDDSDLLLFPSSYSFFNALHREFNQS